MRLRLLTTVSAFAAVTVLAGCTDTKSGTFLVSPARFTLYNCKELADYQGGAVARQRQLEKLMAQSRQESSGTIVNAIAYQPEYQNVLGEIKVLREEAAQKGCTLPDPYAAPPAPVALKPATPARRRR
jgi:hypothetical protein